jgi:ribosomal-protein-alanine N-acetyltransferase
MTEEVLQTERLRLRRLVPEVLHALHRLYGDPELMRTITGAPRSLEKTQQRLRAHLADEERYGFGLYAAMLRARGQMIGRCGLEPKVDEEGLYGDLAWMFLREYWGQDPATEAGGALIAYGLGPLGLGSHTRVLSRSRCAGRRATWDSSTCSQPRVRARMSAGRPCCSSDCQSGPVAQRMVCTTRCSEVFGSAAGWP